MSEIRELNSELAKETYVVPNMSIIPCEVV